MISALALDVVTAAGSSPETAFWTAVSFLLVRVIVSGCNIVRLGMGWGGAVLDVGCSRAIAWSDFSLLGRKKSDSSDTN